MLGCKNSCSLSQSIGAVFSNSRPMESSPAKRVTRLALVFLDLDHFKRVNDTYGHDAGDAVLRSMAEALRVHYRGDDVICRYGGEEFAIILPESTAQEAAKRSESLRQGVKKLTIAYGGKVLDKITVSIGIAAYPEQASNAADLLRAADSGLYRSKSKGRDCITTTATCKG
jgi:diguanylate cyclase (GGDEF)-like protein